MTGYGSEMAHQKRKDILLALLVIFLLALLIIVVPGTA
jgi:Zn-dependent protease with chaperone function